MNRLSEYLKASVGSWPARRIAGTESDWLSIGDLPVTSGSLWIGDPMVISKECGYTLKVPAGIYHIEGKGMDFGGHRRVARVRALLDGAEASELKENKEVDIDQGHAAVCDIDELDAISDEIEEPQFGLNVSKILLRGRCGIAQFPLKTSVCSFAFTSTGFGDGSGKIFDLLHRDLTVGVEAQFLAPNSVPPERD